MKLYAIADLHLSFAANREAFGAIPPHPDDWLILAGDVGDRPEHLEDALSFLRPRFRRLLWTPGNHDLWSPPSDPAALKGDDLYRRLVEICRSFDVQSPEDDYPVWEGEGGPCIVAPTFVLYDYTFRPDEIPVEQAVDWAKEAGICCADEHLLDPHPFGSRSDWCVARCAFTEERLAEASRRLPLVIVNHFPLRQDLAILPAIPRFTIWCGTRRTEDWHLRYRAKVVVSGHLHIRSTKWRDGVRFEEVSLGYPRHWNPDRGIASYFREILPGKV